MSVPFCLMVFTALTLWAAGAKAFVGSVKMVQGGAVVNRGADALPVQEGMQLFVNDILKTSADGRLGVILEDGTRIALGPNTELKLDRFVYQPVEGKFSLVLRLGRGMLAYILERSPGSLGIRQCRNTGRRHRTEGNNLRRLDRGRIGVSR